MQGILIFRSGVPYTVTMSRDVANTGVGGQRPNRIASGKLDDPTLERWFDPAAFVAAPNFIYGNSGLRILSPDIVRTVDFSMFKNFQITEGSRLQFRMGGVQSAEYAELRRAEFDSRHRDRGPRDGDVHRAAPDAGGAEVHFLEHHDDY